VAGAIAYCSYPGVTETTKQRLLQQAAKLVGREELAARLRVPINLLEAWLQGSASMPDRKLVQLAEVLDQFGRAEK
jgi:transcriptional regulator with XRE-family HTH domain